MNLTMYPDLQINWKNWLGQSFVNKLVQIISSI